MPTIHASPKTSRLSWILGSYVCLGGLTSFLGWAFDLPRLADWLGRGVSIQPNACLAAAASGASLVLLTRGPRVVAGMLGALAALIGGATMVEHVTGRALGIDSLFLFGRTWGTTGTLDPGRMGPPGSLSWALIGLGLVMMASGSPRVRRFVPGLAAFVCAVASLSLIG